MFCVWGKNFGNILVTFFVGKSGEGKNDVMALTKNNVTLVFFEWKRRDEEDVGNGRNRRR